MKKIDHKLLPDKTKTSIRVISSIILALLIFLLGIGIGNGEIPIKVANIFNKNQNAGLPATLNYSALQDEYELLKGNYDGKLTAQQLQNGIQQGLANSTGDPYTEYFSPSAAKSFNDQLNNTFSGIGAQLGANSSGQLVIISPISGFPAAKAGLKPDDIITSINGKSTTNLNIDSAVNEIRGAAGTKVTLDVTRGSQQLTFNITRANITLPSVETKILSGNIGYIQIVTFANDTSELATKAANTFKQDHVKGIILDLRDNPGGLVTAAVNVSSLWLPAGKTIMVQKHDNKVTQTYVSTGTDTLGGIPTAVLINGGSASASEITASALDDNGAATTIGTKSFGKGTVQELDPLPDGAEIKITIEHWFTPDGKTIEHLGITPDQVVPITTQDQQSGTDTQLNAAISYVQNHS
jgi:carboxyl-terminal processing protease